jgi:hypothetical protein
LGRAVGVGEVGVHRQSFEGLGFPSGGGIDVLEVALGVAPVLLGVGFLDADAGGEFVFDEDAVVVEQGGVLAVGGAVLETEAPKGGGENQVFAVEERFFGDVVDDAGGAGG